MKVLKSWLKDYVEIDLSDNVLSDRLTMTGTAVDSMVQTLDNKIIVAKILEINKHPNADRLRITKVDNGSGTLQVVCGAPNIEIGQHVPLAQIGAKIGETEITKASIRGIESSGMLCSEKELGLGEDHTGIKILPNEYEIGKPLIEYVQADAVLDIEITPNRGDELSHYGIAREIAAVTDRLLTNKQLSELDYSDKQKLNITIEDQNDCFQYSGLLISSVLIEESPNWLKERLIACGVRPINNIVDITNYIMLDLGQPLHAFDADKIVDHEIIVRLAGEGEKITTLDGNIRKLDQSMLLISDKEKPLAIAGVIGGKDSEVTTSTKNIILESAEFSRTSVRKTAKKLRLSTEASYRFERGIDSGSVTLALEKAAAMIMKLAGGKLASEVCFAGSVPKPRTVVVEYKKINSLLGLKLEQNEIDQILVLLGFEINNGVATIPLWRHDICIWQDLAEEVGRVHGFENIPHNQVAVSALPQKTNYYKKEYLKDILVESGFSEVYTYPFLSEADLKVVQIDPEDLLEVANPAQIENKYMRKSLLPGLLKSIAKNPSFDPVLIFEIGNVFTKDTETNRLAIAASGKGAKKAIETAVDQIALKTSYEQKIDIHEISRNELVRYKIRKPFTYFIEIETARLIKNMDIADQELALKIGSKATCYRPISKFPSVTRDVAFIVGKDLEASGVREAILEVSDIINRVELFDEFVSDKFGTGKKNIAYHLDLQHQETTLTDKEADEIVNRVVQAVEGKYKAKLRES